MSAYVEKPDELSQEWLADWDWGEFDKTAAIGGATILWQQIVDDVSEFGRPMLGMYPNVGPAIAVGILGQAEHFIIIPLAEIDDTMEESERVAVAAALVAMAFRIGLKR